MELKAKEIAEDAAESGLARTPDEKQAFYESALQDLQAEERLLHLKANRELTYMSELGPPIMVGTWHLEDGTLHLTDLRLDAKEQPNDLPSHWTYEVEGGFLVSREYGVEYALERTE